MKRLSFIVCLVVVGVIGCQKEDPACKALPGRRMAEVQVLSLASTLLPPGPEQSQYHVSFHDGIWEVSCESNHILKTVRIQDADGKIEQVRKP
jgi:hypothetical protein